jgi:hypothetical protein
MTWLSHIFRKTHKETFSKICPNFFAIFAKSYPQFFLIQTKKFGWKNIIVE